MLFFLAQDGGLQNGAGSDFILKEDALEVAVLKVHGVLVGIRGRVWIRVVLRWMGVELSRRQRCDVQVAVDELHQVLRGVLGRHRSWLEHVRVSLLLTRHAAGVRAASGLPRRSPHVVFPKSDFNTTRTHRAFPPPPAGLGLALLSLFCRHGVDAHIHARALSAFKTNTFKHKTVGTKPNV